MKPIYEDITSNKDDIHMEILEDITPDEEELIAGEELEYITSKEEKEEKTLDNDNSDEEEEKEEGNILLHDYDDENEQPKHALTGGLIVFTMLINI
uniref:Uncharacterized protein n=1 Tax=Romanomermis culicivorax TaxID=13658 RepID=A0A915JXY2_ROMCU